MTKLQAFYQRTAKLEEFVILAYAVAVYLPITYTWIALIAGIVVFVLRAILEASLKKKGLAFSELSENAPAAAKESSTDDSERDSWEHGLPEGSEKPENAPDAKAENSERESWERRLPAGFEKPPGAREGGTYGAPGSFESTCHAIKSAPFAIPLLVFTVVVFITGFCKGGISEAFASVLTLRTFLVYFIAYRAFQKSDALLRNTLLMLFSAGAVAGVYGTIQQLFNFHPGYPYLQATGFLDHPMAYAGQMETTACLSVGIFLAGGWQFLLKNRVLFLLITVANLAGAYFASERSAWLGLMVAVLAMSALVSMRTFGKVLMGLAVVAVLSWFFIPVVQARILPMINNINRDVGVQARFVIWKQSMEIWKEHPIVGVGPRDFPKIDIPEAIIPGESTHLVHAHSNILQMMATMGTVGLLAFLYLQFSTLFVAFSAWTSRNEDMFHRAIALGVLGGIVSLMVAGLFEYNFGTGHVRLMHWFVLAMLVRNAKPRSAATTEVSDA